MLAETIAAALSTLRKPTCSLDIFHPYVLDKVDAKSPVHPTSCWVNTEAVSIDARHPIEGAQLSGGKMSSPRETCYLQRELSQPRQMGPHPTRQEADASHRQDEPDRVVSTRALRSRIERLEAKLDLYKLDTPNTALEAAPCVARSQGAHMGNEGRDGHAGNLSRNSESRKMMKTERRRQRLVKPAGSTAIHSLSNTSTKADVPTRVTSRRRRALDLGISGTAKFKFNGERASRPKLVRLQNQWCRVGGVDG